LNDIFINPTNPFIDENNNSKSLLFNSSIVSNNLISSSYKTYDSDLKELNPISLTYLHKFNQFYLIASKFNSRGSDLFQESRISLLNSFQFGNRFLTMFTINYDNLFVKNYNNQSKLSLDLTGQVKVIDKLMLAFTINNIFNKKYILQSEYNDRAVAIGVSYLYNNNLNLSFSLINKFGQLGINSNIYFELNKYFNFNIIYSTLAPAVNSNFGVNINYFSLYLGLEYVSYIGYTSNIALRFQF